LIEIDQNILFVIYTLYENISKLIKTQIYKSPRPDSKIQKIDS